MKTRRRIFGLVVAALMVALSATPAAAKHKGHGDDLYVPPPNPGATKQIAKLNKHHQKAAARRIKAMINTPQAVWFTAGTPRSVERDVRKTVKKAAAKRSIPVLVAYNIPFRDCAQFSAGGATTRTGTRNGSTDSRPASETTAPS
jgi:endoglucanase